MWKLPPVVPCTLLALLRIGGIALAAVLYLALRIWADRGAGSELALEGPTSLLFPRALQFQAFYALAALLTVKYVLLCAIVVGLLMSLFGPRRGWLYGLIVGVLTTVAWIFGYRAYWNHLPLWLDAWDAAAESFAVTAPALVAFYVNRLLACVARYSVFRRLCSLVWRSATCWWSFRVMPPDHWASLSRSHSSVTWRYASANNGVELTAAGLSVFDWLFFIVTFCVLAAAVAHPERSPLGGEEAGLPAHTEANKNAR